MKKLVLIIFIFMLITFVKAQTVSHNASQIRAGTFGQLVGNGNYVFPDNLGIGTYPIQRLTVLGDVNFTGTLVQGSVPWSRLSNYPSPCQQGFAVQAIGDSLTCIQLNATPGISNITSVLAGTGLTGGGSSGSITLGLNSSYESGSIYDQRFINEDQSASGEVTGLFSNLQLSTTGVSQGVYGSPSHSIQLTVDSKGRILSASNLTVNIDTSQITSGTISNSLLDSNIYFINSTGLSASNITSGTLPISFGGTGASTADQARASLSSSGIGNCPQGQVVMNLTTNQPQCVEVDMNPNDVAGSGSIGYIPLWNGTSSLNNSVIYQNEGNVGIGTETPLAKVEINNPSGVALNVSDVFFVNSTTGGIGIGSASINSYIEIPGSIKDGITIGTYSHNTNKIGIKFENIVNGGSHIYFHGDISDGEGIKFFRISQNGIGIRFGDPSFAGLTAGTAIYMYPFGFSSNGKMIDISGNSNNLIEYKNNIIQIISSRYGGFGIANDTANFLNITRNDTITSNGMVKLSDLVFFSSNCKEMGGTCNDSSSILKIEQNFNTSNGSVVKITNLGLGKSLLIEDEYNDNTPFVVDSSGKVGIGLTNPSAELEVAGNVNASTYYDRQSSQYYLDPSATSIVNNLQVASGTLTGANSESISIGATDNVISFTSGGSERMRIHNSNVGIGTASPTSKLHVVSDLEEMPISGDMRFQKENGWLLYNNEVYSSSHPYHSPQFVIERARGTISNPLTVQLGDQIGGFYFRGYDGNSWEQNAGISAWVSGSVSNDLVPMDIIFLTGSTAYNLGGSNNIRERVRISSTGNVGIGTTNPTSSLEINTSSSNGLSLNVSDSLFVNASSKRIGIGTSNPSTELEVKGGIKIDPIQTLPECNQTLRGTIWFFKSNSGESDKLYFCMKNKTDEYNWIMIGLGDLD
ncbi:MAG: hypothetical protein QXM68_01525 [Candidatus Aenigmatarchaeota archaeon]|nr:hypothetical protein [Candidatus Aenigmarchaeota archaeon]